MNLVDCSQETIDKNWARIRVEHNVVAEVDYTKAENQDENATLNDERSPQFDHISGAEWAVQKQDILGRWISKGLQAVFVKIIGLDISADAFDEFSELTAEMLGKYHPNLSAFEIIAKYERELLFGYSALMLTVVIVKAFKRKALIKKPNESAENVEIVEGELVYDK